jgi:hypothetical protein
MSAVALSEVSVLVDYGGQTMASLPIAAMTVHAAYFIILALSHPARRGTAWTLCEGGNYNCFCRGRNNQAGRDCYRPRLPMPNIGEVVRERMEAVGGVANLTGFAGADRYFGPAAMPSYQVHRTAEPEKLTSAATTRTSSSSSSSTAFATVTTGETESPTSLSAAVADAAAEIDAVDRRECGTEVQDLLDLHESLRGDSGVLREAAERLKEATDGVQYAARASDNLMDEYRRERIVTEGLMSLLETSVAARQREAHEESRKAAGPASSPPASSLPPPPKACSARCCSRCC